MYLAVKLWGSISNKPIGMPDIWPAEIQELGLNRELPGPDWILMTVVDFICFKKKHQHLYDQYQRSLPVEE